MKRITAVIFAAMLILCSCGQQSVKSDRLSIVTTIFPQYDIARSIGGDLAEYTMLLKPGGELHTYEPTPADIIKIKECDLFICVGGESEAWIDGVLEATDVEETKVLRMLDVIENKQKIENHDEYDEHIWTSPVNAKIISKEISEKMCLLDEKNRSVYEQNHAEYERELNEIDEAFRMTVNSSERKTILVADRFPFTYLVKEYGISYYTAFAGCSEESEPSPSKIAFLIDELKKEKFPVVFKVDFSNGKIAETVAEGTDARILTLKSGHTVPADDFEKGITYIDIMRDNLRNIKEALQ